MDCAAEIHNVSSTFIASAIDIQRRFAMLSDTDGSVVYRVFVITPDLFHDFFFLSRCQNADEDRLGSCAIFCPDCAANVRSLDSHLSC